MKAVLAMLWLLLALTMPARAASVSSGSTMAPPLRRCTSTPEKDLGEWDDIFVCEEQDLIALRRADALYSLAMTGALDPVKRAETPIIQAKEIVASVGLGDRLWLLMHGGNSGPCAIDLFSGQVSSFDIPAIRKPEQPLPEIESHVSAPHLGSVLVKVVERDTLPQYFWMSLESGEVVQLPRGAGPSYFSTDQRVAVFQNPPWAMDMATGDPLDTFPDRSEVPYILSRSRDADNVSTIFKPHSRPSNPNGIFAGFSVRGLVLLFDLPIEEIRDVPASPTNGTLPEVRFSGNRPLARVKGDYVGFRYLHDGANRATPLSLWIVARKQHSLPEFVASSVVDYAMLKRGNCVFITAEYGPKGTSASVFFYDHDNDLTWSLLTDVQRPGLDKEILEKNKINDESTVRLIEGFGDRENEPLILCRFSHVQTAGSPSLPPYTPAHQTKWRCAMLVTSNGQRYETDLFREGGFPANLWLHNSGKVVISRDVDQPTDAMGERKKRLSEITLRLPNARE